MLVQENSRNKTLECKKWDTFNSDELEKSILSIKHWGNLIKFINTIGNYWLENKFEVLKSNMGEHFDRRGKCYEAQPVPKSMSIILHYKAGNRTEWKELKLRDVSYGRDISMMFTLRIQAIKIDCKGKAVGKPFNYQIGQLVIERMYNCCGMAVFTNLQTYLKNNEGIGSGTLMTFIGEILAYSQKYNAVCLTNRKRWTKMNALGNMGYTVQQEWQNKRTRTELFMASKDLSKSKEYFYTTFEYLTGAPKEIREDLSELLDDEVKELIEKKPETKKEIKKKAFKNV